MKIIFVCTGNTCRSPMAQAIAKQKIKRMGLDKLIKVDSAGLKIKPGDVINEKAKIALKKLGVKIGKRMCKQFDFSKIGAKDLVITMTDTQKNYINLRNCFSVADFCKKEVADPFGLDQEVYDKTANQLEEAIEIILNRIVGGEK